jgi:hypothetical protein
MGQTTTCYPSQPYRLKKQDIRFFLENTLETLLNQSVALKNAKNQPEKQNLPDFRSILDIFKVKENNII